MLLPYIDPNRIEAGCDEAGRGCLAGAVYAAAVILPTNFRCEALNDSKKLSEKQRYALRSIIEKEAISWAIGIVSPEEIDKINILNASFLAMHRAIEQLKVTPEHLLIDGNRFKPYPKIGHSCIINRDDYMLQLHQTYPQYGWNKNKGYPTKAHRNAIKEYGTTPYHRMTFQLLERQQSLF